MRKEWLMISIILAVGAGAASGGAEKPKRLMPYLCRDAVVREDGPKMVLLEKTMNPPAAIVVGKASEGNQAAEENKQIRKAAEVLSEYLAKITGVECPVVESSAASGGVPRIFVGADGDASTAFPELKDADDHGFVIAARDGDLHIVGGSGVATVYGAWFFLYHDAGNLVFLAGGIGITPFISMLRYIRDKQLDRRVVLIWGNKTENDIAFREELDQMVAEMPRLEVVHVMSRQADWPGEKGYVTADLLRRIIGDVERPQVFICGPPVMRDKVVQALREVGVSKQRIHYERFALR